MYIPANSLHFILFFLVVLIAWTSWANFFKSKHVIRTELVFFDFSIGILLTSIIIAVTLGSLGTSAPSVLANLAFSNITHYIQAIIAGILFNIAAIFLVHSIARIGLAITFPVAMGINVLLSTIFDFFIVTRGAIFYLFLGLALMIICTIIGFFAIAKKIESKQEISKSRVVVVLAGVILSFHFGMIENAMTAPFALNPYSTILLFSLGFFLSNLVSNTVFMKKGNDENPLKFSDYKAMPLRSHFRGLIAGALWCTGVSFYLVVTSVSVLAVGYVLWLVTILLTSLCGLVIWKEFKGIEKTTKTFTALYLSFILGAICLGIATSAFSGF